MGLVNIFGEIIDEIVHVMFTPEYMSVSCCWA
jgi:hypothetical protein